MEKQLRAVPAASLADQRGSAPWKVRVAVAMKATTDADNRWLAGELRVGSARYLAKLVSYARREEKQGQAL